MPHSRDAVSAPALHVSEVTQERRRQDEVALLLAERSAQGRGREVQLFAGVVQPRQGGRHLEPILPAHSRSRWSANKRPNM
jgi:hypothetical protein